MDDLDNFRVVPYKPVFSTLPSKLRTTMKKVYMPPIRGGGDRSEGLRPALKSRVGSELILSREGSRLDTAPGQLIIGNQSFQQRRHQRTISTTVLQNTKRPSEASIVQKDGEQVASSIAQRSLTNSNIINNNGDGNNRATRGILKKRNVSMDAQYAQPNRTGSKWNSIFNRSSAEISTKPPSNHENSSANTSAAKINNTNSNIGNSHINNASVPSLRLDAGRGYLHKSRKLGRVDWAQEIEENKDKKLKDYLTFNPQYDSNRCCLNRYH
jgi:hypothetical protein